MRDEVAEYAAAFANADGGVLILGVEDDGTPTGCPYQDEGALRALLEAPVGRAVMVEGNGFPYRQGDAVLQVSEEFINRAKDEGLVSSPEAKMAPNGLGDLDRALIERAMDAAGFSGTPEEYLVQRRLADWRPTCPDRTGRRRCCPRYEGEL